MSSPTFAWVRRDNPLVRHPVLGGGRSRGHRAYLVEIGGVNTDAYGAWLMLYESERARVLKNIPLSAPIDYSWISGIKARWYCGSMFFDEESPRRVRLSPIEEAALVRTVTQLIEKCDQWKVEGCYFSHKPSGLKIWVSNESYGLHIEFKDYISLRERSRRRLWKAFNSWKKASRRSLNLPSGYAEQLIKFLEHS